MHELMFQAGVKGISERSELIPCISYKQENMEVIIFRFSYCLDQQQFAIVYIRITRSRDDDCTYPI